MEFLNEQFMADATSAIMMTYLNAAKRKNNSVSPIVCDRYTPAKCDSYTDTNFGNCTMRTNLAAADKEGEPAEFQKWRGQTKNLSISDASDDEDIDVLGLKRKVYYSPAVSTYGLKLVSCSIPKKSVRKVKRVSEVVPHASAGFCGKVNGFSSQNNRPQKNDYEKKDILENPSQNGIMVCTPHPVAQSPYGAISIPLPSNKNSVCPCSSSKTNESVNKRFRHNSKENALTISSPQYTDDSESKMLCVVVQSVKNHKYHEIMTSLQDFQRQRRTFPKLQDVIPDVGNDGKELKYSPEAVKTVLGYLFSPSYNFSATQNEITAVEILAMIRSWGIIKFQVPFKEHFMKNILKESNANRIYSFAHNFDLADIQGACSQLTTDLTVQRYKDKICTVSVNTYQESLEFAIPLQPISENLSESFDRDIINDLVFESLSGNFDITGFAVQLNVDKSTKKSMSEKLNIHYSTESSVEDLNIPQRTASKSLGSTIIIYFKRKLIVRSGQKIKISVEMQTKPCLCWTLKRESIRGELTNGKFNLTLTSNRKPLKSDKSLFVVGKLFYHVKDLQF